MVRIRERAQVTQRGGVFVVDALERPADRFPIERRANFAWRVIEDAMSSCQAAAVPSDIPTGHRFVLGRVKEQVTNLLWHKRRALRRRQRPKGDILHANVVSTGRRAVEARWRLHRRTVRVDRVANERDTRYGRTCA